ncbi:MAG: hypothetical protein LBU73_09155 [Helicobacteraceae bacterium]|nr:hypothetical protein [Helicobacteraceae bacterium]
MPKMTEQEARSLDLAIRNAEITLAKSKGGSFARAIAARKTPERAIGELAREKIAASAN